MRRTSREAPVTCSGSAQPCGPPGEGAAAGDVDELQQAEVEDRPTGGGRGLGEHPAQPGALKVSTLPVRTTRSSS